MSTTAGDLISRALRLIGVLASGENTQAAEASDALTSLNNLLDSWSTESLLVPTKTREVFPLVPGKQTYTMGVGGDLNTQRPTRIETAEIQITSVTPVIELPLRLWTQPEYAAIAIKTLSSTYPQGIYPDHAAPLISLNLWPVPSQVNNLVLYSVKPLANLATLTTAVSLPPGYERAIRFSLAVELAPEYGREVSEVVALVASESKSNLKRINSRPQYLEVEQALRARSSVWNWYTGEPT